MGSELMAESVFFQQAVENRNRVAVSPPVDEAAVATRQSRSGPTAGVRRPSQVPAAAATTRQPGSLLDGVTALPEDLKAEVKSLSGISMDDVNVHYNSLRPSLVQAWAYTQGTDIYVAPGQEHHLAHEAWHVVQQKQRRVQPTSPTAGAPINDDPALEDEADEMGTKAIGAETGVAPLGFAGTLSGGQDAPINSGSEGLYPIQRVGPERRPSTKVASFGPYDRQGRTRRARDAAALRAGANLPEPPRNLALSPFKKDITGTYLWNGFSRPTWGGADDDYYDRQPAKKGKKADGTKRWEYKCVVDEDGTKEWLPRKQDSDPGEDWATIGHIVQWRDYIVKNADTEQWTVQGGGTILAISQDEANMWYRDVNNFELQSQSYNSSVAMAYKTSDAPGQSWVG